MARDLSFGIRLRADGSGFVGEMRVAGDAVRGLGRDAQEAAAQVDRAGGEMEAALTRASAIGTTFGVIVGQVLVDAAKRFYSEFRASISVLDDLADAAQGLGVTAQQLSALEISAQAAGVGSGQLSQALNLLNRRMADAANGGEKSAAIFKALGIATTDANGNLRSTADVLGDVAEKFSGYENGANKSALANELFGRSGAKLIAFLNEGRDGLDKFGGASQSAIEEAAKLQSEIDKASAAWERFKLSVVGAVAGLVNAAIEIKRGSLDAQLAATERALADISEALDRASPGSRIERNLLEQLRVEQNKLREIERAIAQRDFVGPPGPLAQAPNVERASREPRAGRQRKEELVGPPDRVIAEQYRERQRELEKLLNTFERYEESQRKQIAALAEGNQRLREQNEEIGLSAFQIDELRAKRLDDAVATKEQQLQIMALAGERSEDIQRMQQEIELLRERAGLIRQGSAARQGVDTRREIEEASKRSLAEQKEASREVGRLLGDALMRGFERGENVAENFARSVGNLLRTQATQGLADALLSLAMRELGGGGGASGLFDFIGSAFISVFGLHSGGIAGGTPTFRRTMPAAAFAGAPRYHEGGVAGEVPAILKRGEGVFTPEQMRNLAPVGSATPVTVNVINNSAAQVTTRDNGSGSIDVIIEQVASALGGDIARGRGPINQALQGQYGLRPVAR